MLLTPYSSTTAMSDWRTPVRSDATVMTTHTPMTIPSIVSALRSLCARSESNAMRMISTGTNLGTLSFMIFLSLESEVWSLESRTLAFDSRLQTLLSCQRNDGVEPRGAERGVDARDEADASGDADREHDVEERDRHRHARRRRDEPRDADGEEEAEDAAARRQERRLDQELQQHLLARRADRLSESDLEGALGHRDEHDVHHHDGPDDERDGRDRHDDERDAARERVNVVGDLARVDQPEVVVLAALQLVLVPHGRARVFDGLVELLARGGLAVNLYALQPAEDFAVGRQRHVQLLVERLAEHRAALLFDADDRQRHPPHADGLPYRVLSGEEFFFQVVADDGDHRRRVVLLLQEEAPLANRLVFDDLHVGRAALHLGAGLRAGRAVLVHPFVVVEVENLVAPVHAIPLLC